MLAWHYAILARALLLGLMYYDICIVYVFWFVYEQQYLSVGHTLMEDRSVANNDQNPHA